MINKTPIVMILVVKCEFLNFVLNNNYIFFFIIVQKKNFNYFNFFNYFFLIINFNYKIWKDGRDSIISKRHSYIQFPWAFILIKF